MRDLMCLSALVLARTALCQQAVFVDIGTPGGDALVRGVSGDGGTVVLDGAYRWTRLGGFQALGFAGIAWGASFDGGVITGGFNGSGIRWTQATGPVVIAPDRGKAVSYDGSFIGLEGGAIGRWSAAGIEWIAGFTEINRVAGISTDGSVLAYTGRQKLSGSRAYRWREAIGIQYLGDLPGGAEESTARGMSPDGRVVVGNSRHALSYGAFRWTQAHGMRSIGPTTESTCCLARVGADGWRVIGNASPALFPSARYIWDPVHGMRYLEAQLSAWGATGFESWVALEFIDISHDGRTIVGDGIRETGQPFRAFIVTIPAFCYANCDGSSTAPALNVADFTCFLQKFAANDIYGNCNNDGAMDVADFTCFLQKFVAGCGE
jgi:hypothetical protein